MEECNKSAETKKVNIATRFVSWMSTPGRICHNIEAPIATKEIGRKQKFCRDKKLKSNTRRSICRDKVNKVATCEAYLVN